MKNLKISAKLIISFLVVAVMCATTGIVGIVALTQTRSETDLLNNRAGAALNFARVNRVVQQQMRIMNKISVWGLDNDTDAVQEGFKDVDSLRADTDKLYETLNAFTLSEEGKAWIEKASNERTGFKSGVDDYYNTIIDASHTEDVHESATMIITAQKAIAPIVNSYTGILGEAGDWFDSATTQQTVALDKLSRTLTILLAAVLILAIAVAIFFALYISGIIATPIVRIVGWIKQTGTEGNLIYPQSEWDYCAKIAKQRDEIGVLADSYAKMVQVFLQYDKVLSDVSNQNLSIDVPVIGASDNLGNSLKTTLESLNNAFDEINNATTQVSSGSKQIADGAQSLAQGSTQQAAAVEQLSASIAEVAQSAKQNGTDATRAAELADNVRTNAEKGSSQMTEMVTAVQEITDASQNIQKVIKVIDDIAFQTNILALNAAVEAARAGQHGKGFAVVAEEVRNLAAKSAEAAKDTGVLIQTSVDKATYGAKIAQETNESLSEIVAGIDETSTIVNTIASGAAMQAEAISQINNGIDQVAQVVQQNSATSEESAATAEELSSQSNALEGLVGEFQLRGGASARQHHAPALRSARSSEPKTLAMPPKGSTSAETSDFGKY